MPIMQKTADFLGLKLADLLSENIAEVIARINENESWRNTKLYQPIPLTEADLKAIKDLGITPEMVQRLQYIPVLRAVPASVDDWEETLKLYQIDITVTNYEEGGTKQLFAVKMNDEGMGEVIKKDALVIIDPGAQLEDGRFAAVRLNDEKYLIRYFYDYGDQILLQSANLPPEIYKKSEIEAYYRVVQITQFV